MSSVIDDGKRCSGHPGRPCPKHFPEGYASAAWRRQNALSIANGLYAEEIAAGDAERSLASRMARDAIDLDELRNEVLRLRPITPSLNASSSLLDSPRDASLDSWGRRQGTSSMAAWVDGNCLRFSIATALQVDVKKVPDPTPDFPHDDWFTRFNERLGTKGRVKLSDVSAARTAAPARLIGMIGPAAPLVEYPLAQMHK